MSKRLIQISFGTCISLYMLLVCFNNITDYGSNFQFVSMVSGMDDVASKANTGWRSVHGDVPHHLIYLGIITVEIVIAMLSLFGTVQMTRRFRSDILEFESARKWLVAGLALGVVLWFGLFIGVGGEWFLMWQSESWNGQQTAFFLTITFLLFLVYLSKTEAADT